MKTKFFVAPLLLCALTMVLTACPGPREKEIVTPPGSGVMSNHEYVDLGLSVKWASTNIGARTAKDAGEYFAWGETVSKQVYDKSTYKYCNNSYNDMTKYDFYTSDADYFILEMSDDAARQQWGGGWRMPTKDEFEELIKKCTWEWVDKDGERGFLVYGTNGNSIFLPAAGHRENEKLYMNDYYGYYWSSYTQSFNGASNLIIYSAYDKWTDELHGVKYIDGTQRGVGLSVRPVCR